MKIQNRIVDICLFWIIEFIFNPSHLYTGRLSRLFSGHFFSSGCFSSFSPGITPLWCSCSSIYVCIILLITPDNNFYMCLPGSMNFDNSRGGISFLWAFVHHSWEGLLALDSWGLHKPVLVHQKGSLLKLKYSWFTMQCYFLQNEWVIHTYAFFFTFFSIMV